MKKFNTTGVCVPDKHYMVDTTRKLNKIRKLIEEEEYFTINRSRQYGKTTTLASLFRMLKDDYIVLRLSFEGAGSGAFQSDENFVMYFIRSVAKALKYASQSAEIIERWRNHEDYKQNEYEDAFEYLSDKITWLCGNREKEILLFIDEVDKTSDNQIFLNFLGMLRNKYIARQEGMDDTFKSVILAGVYDITPAIKCRSFYPQNFPSAALSSVGVATATPPSSALHMKNSAGYNPATFNRRSNIKNLKLRLRPEAERKYNSPWNIAADFDVDMSFHPEEIATMLQEYEEDYHTGMDIAAVSEELYHYTQGYPYLVSWLCKWIDEKGEKDWTRSGVELAVKNILETKGTLFDDLSKKYDSYPELAQMIDDMLFGKKKYPYFLADDTVALGVMFGIFGRRENELRISNIIFEQYFTNKIIIRNIREDHLPQPETNQFIKDGKLVEDRQIYEVIL